jgi:geranylgeranyl pyrophosphate synthase
LTYTAQLEIQSSLSDEEAPPSYLISKPNALLENVENYMLEVLKGDSELVIADSAVLNEAIEYHLRSGGQRLRARLALSAGQALGLSEEDSITIASAVELIHNASLIHDDLQDGDQYRRSHESVWSKFGSNAAICCGDFYLSTAYACLAGISNTRVLPKMIQIMHQRIAEASYGQSADLTITAEQLTLETYLEVVMAKSGALLSLPLELVLLLAGHNQARPLAHQACKDFAVGFQIFDDLRDLATDSRSVEDGGDRLNIIAIFEHSSYGMDISDDPIQAAKEVAIQHLKRSELSLVQLPSQAGSLLKECTENIASLVRAIH